MKILIYPNLDKKNAMYCTQLTLNLLFSNNAEVFMDVKYKNLFSEFDIQYASFHELIQVCDVIITIGGDGTILKCAKYACSHNKPILGINSGRLGFMASVESNEISLIDKLFSNEYMIEERMMMKITHYVNGEENVYDALNDIVIARPYSKICDYSVLVNSKLIYNLRADGMVLSTPTGSTAYSLSAGGPVIEPDLECIELTPICSHSLFSRSIIFSPGKEISIKLIDKDKNDIYFIIDGAPRTHFSIDDTLTITKSHKTLKLIDLKGEKFFDSVNNKLMQSIKGAD